MWLALISGVKQFFQSLLFATVLVCIHCQFTLIAKILIAICPIARILIAKSTIAQMLTAKSNNCRNTDCPNTDCPDTDCPNTDQPELRAVKVGDQNKILLIGPVRTHFARSLHEALAMFFIMLLIEAEKSQSLFLGYLE